MTSDPPIALVTGFDWYRGEGYAIYHPNPSGIIAHRLDNTVINGYSVKGIVLKVEQGCIMELRNIITSLKPRIVIGLGLHPGARNPLLELVAVNHLRESFDILSLTKIIENKPLVVPIPINYEELLTYLWKLGYTVYPSNTLGLYYCNAVAYTIYSYGLENKAYTVFYHIPPVSELLFRLGYMGDSVKWSIDLLVKLVVDTIKFFIDKQSEQA